MERQDHADERDVEQRIGEVERGVGDAAALDVGGVGQRQRPGEGQQGAADEPGVEGEADPAGAGDGALGEDEQADDGGWREAEEEEVGDARVRDLGVEDDLVPAPGGVAQRGHGGGDAEEDPGGPEAAAAGAGVEEAGDGGDPRGDAQAEVTHRHGEPGEPQPRTAPTAYPPQTRARRSWPRTPEPAGPRVGSGPVAAGGAGGAGGMTPGPVTGGLPGGAGGRWAGGPAGGAGRLGGARGTGWSGVASDHGCVGRHGCPGRTASVAPLAVLGFLSPGACRPGATPAATIHQDGHSGTGVTYIQ